jgi:hypothetical protein
MAKKTIDHGEPKFPYTTDPKSLRRLLAEIPKRPRPTKLTFDTLKAWNVSNNNNARTAINVLKKLGLLGSTGEPTPKYVEFMKTGTGPVVLGACIKELYGVLFENSHAPQDESEDVLKNLFHIHSGGGEDAMRLQIQTFKALSEYAKFTLPGEHVTSSGTAVRDTGNVQRANPPEQHLPPIQVDLHIHLPENKSSRDYEAIIQDIARYIYGRNVEKP